MTRTLKVLSGTAALAVFTIACGGGSSSPTGGNPPQAGPGNPGANPTPAPAPAPTPDPRAGLPNGPVTRFTIKVRTVNNGERDRKSTRLNSSHLVISYAVCCLPNTTTAYG